MGQCQFVCGSNLGAPALGTLGTGDLVRVLDAALNAGLTAQAVTIAVASGVATVTLAAHSWYKSQLTTIAGVAGGPTGFALLNGVKRIASIPGSGTFTFAAPGVSDGAATGSITAKISALGEAEAQPWGIAFTATNQRAYRAAAGLRHYLMVNDNSNTNTSIVRGFRTMSAVTTGVGPFPTVSQSSTNLKWPRPDPTTYTDLDWVVIGDGKRFLIGMNVTSAFTRVWYGFGELPLSLLGGDAFHTFMMGYGNTAGDDTLNVSSAPIFSAPQQSAQGAGTFYSGSALCLARRYDQSTDSLICGIDAGFRNSNAYTSGLLGTSPTAGTPSPISGGIELCHCDVIEYVSPTFWRRARFPIFCCWSPPDFAANDKVTYSGLTNWPDILLLRGDTIGGGVGGNIFPLGDWDTAFS